jgi:hypothetical protein
MERYTFPTACLEIKEATISQKGQIVTKDKYTFIHLLLQQQDKLLHQKEQICLDFWVFALI